MKKNKRNTLFLGIFSLAAFVIWTVAVRFIDLRAIGPDGSTVGFATINGAFHRLTGVHFPLYTVTDWLGLVPLAIACGFGVLGLIQWIKRKDIRKVDGNILILGGFFLTVIALFFLFETVVINYRPVYINGVLEASYPSSTTLLVTCVIPAAIMQFNHRIKRRLLKRIICSVSTVFTVFMVIGRLISGVHWLSDIIGGILLSMGLVAIYRFLIMKK